MENCYELLGLKPGATLSEIRRAYREKVKIYHPDVSGDAASAEHFKKIVRAYEILTDQKSRAIFDSSFAFHFRRRKVKSWDYREWLLARDDDESRAKLIFFDLTRGREEEAVKEFKRMKTERSRFSLKHWFTRENFMDYGFILSEELHAIIIKTKVLHQIMVSKINQHIAYIKYYIFKSCFCHIPFSIPFLY